MKHIHQLQIFFTIFTLVLIPNISPQNWVGVGLFNCLFQKKIFKLGKQTLIFSFSQLHKLVRHGKKHFAKHTERL